MGDLLLLVVVLAALIAAAWFAFKNVEDEEVKRTLRGVLISVGIGLCTLELFPAETGWWYEEVPVYNQFMRLWAWFMVAHGVAGAAHAIVLGLKPKTEEQGESKEKQPFYKPKPVETPKQTPSAPTGTYNTERVPAWKRVEQATNEGTDVVICPKCGTSQRPDRAVCYNCGTKFQE